MDNRTSLFQKMVETITLSCLPTLGGWTRKVMEMEQHVVNGGKVNESGVFMVQAGRKTDSRMDWALAMYGCLPEDDYLRALLIAHYCGPDMLADHTGLTTFLKHMNVREEGAGWSFTQQQNGAIGSQVKKFWNEVARKRILRREK